MAAPQAQRRNAVRFDLLEDLKMDRLSFSRYVLQKELAISTADLDYLFAFPGGKTFEVIFVSPRKYESCLEIFESKSASTPALKKISITPLMDNNIKTVHVVIFSEKIRNEDVWTWMVRHCEVLGAVEVKDIDGIKTGGRRFQVRLRKEDNLVQHLPSTIQLGAHRGSVYYAGQPKLCRRCGGTDHLAANCTTTMCMKCRARDHPTAECHVPVKCNLCLEENHVFRDCPKAYANRLKATGTQMSPRVSTSGDAINERGNRDWIEEGEANQVMATEPPTPREDLQDAPAIQQREARNSTEDVRIFEDFIGDLHTSPGSGRETPEEVYHPLPEVGIHQGPGLQEQRCSVQTTGTPERQAGKKRQQETPNKGSPRTGRTEEVWPALPSPSAPFLDPDSLCSFSMLTQFKTAEQERLAAPKKKKKKKGEQKENDV